MVDKQHAKAQSGARRFILEGILLRVAAGMTVDDARKAEGVSPSQFRTWMLREPDIRERFDAATRHTPQERVVVLAALARVAGGAGLEEAAEAGGMDRKALDALIRKEGMEAELRSALSSARLLAPVRMDAGEAALVLAALAPFWCEAREHPGEGKLVGLGTRAWPSLAVCAAEAGLGYGQVREARKAAPDMWLRLVDARKAAAQAWQEALDELTRLRALSGLALMVGDREGKRVREVRKRRSFIDAEGEIQERDDVTVTVDKVTLPPSVDAIKLALNREDADHSKQMVVQVSEEEAAALLDELDGSDADDFLKLALGQ
jgi:hypothetical protein